MTRVPHPRRSRKLTFVRAAFLQILLTGLLTGPALAQVDPIEGDVNDDGFVGIVDLNIVLGQWNHGDNGINSGPQLEDPRADPSGDGYVGIEDLNMVLGNFNAGYQPGQDFKGMNLHESRYWSREWIFVDIMKRTREWTFSDPATTTDANGWPILDNGDTASTNMVDQIPGFPTGTYVCTYDGTGGTIAFSGNLSNIQTSTGQITFDVAGSEISISMVITGTNPSDPIRNIKIWMPGFDVNSPSTFHPLFVKRLRPFSVIRFMDWQRMNELDDVDWCLRTTPAYFSQSTKTRRGVSVEHMIELCNELDADPWFCMPHKASDAYVTAFATMVLSDLDPTSDVYVEWSNEVWNRPLGEVYDWIVNETTVDPNATNLSRKSAPRRALRSFAQ